jgi:hypothetical protein
MHFISTPSIDYKNYAKKSDTINSIASTQKGKPAEFENPEF